MYSYIPGYEETLCSQPLAVFVTFGSAAVGDCTYAPRQGVYKAELHISTQLIHVALVRK